MFSVDVIAGAAGGLSFPGEGSHEIGHYCVMEGVRCPCFFCWLSFCRVKGQSCLSLAMTNIRWLIPYMSA